ncbi:hypothetical protein [Marinitoga sp. 38H-ov]|uniref:hypothetical protein n=1 Tax=Marinitoga sp. 38H-ov TaxID=1755814 RepID=UPI0013EBA87B|nr:hypothetical protein [Marinitoga sp. 38H-ov]KAF2956330.1 hypothetical protein AS160_06380 [Marinitoga sp. 38H-ov]
MENKMNMKNMSKMMMIQEKLKTLPEGMKSNTNRYWCATCKKFFRLNKPKCPYMTNMCINTPIAVENLSAESPEAIEKFGLYYPKIPQKFLAKIIKNPENLGKIFAKTYIEFLDNWNINYTNQPIQTIKSFVIIISGCETAQRINEQDIAFIIMDPEKVWQDKNVLKDIINEGVNYLKEFLNLDKKIIIDFINIFGEMKIGKYYCQKCGMLFEFGKEREKVTCPLMPQKCMFDPINISNAKFTFEELNKMYKITPEIFKMIIEKVEHRNGREILSKILLDDWNLKIENDELFEHLGIK